MSLNMQKSTCFTILLHILLFTGTALAQIPVNTDSLFREAQEQARLGNYKTSRNALRRVLAVAPGYTDAALLLGRTYAWEEQFDSARLVLKPLHLTEPQNTDILLALADLELWAENPEESLVYSNNGLMIDAEAVPLFYVKARALQQMQNVEGAEATLSQLLQIAPDHPEALMLLEQISGEGKVNLLRVGYQVSTFNKGFSVWQLGTLEYTRETTKGKFLGRLSYADRYEQQSAQFEVDAYPTISKEAYLYLNAGFSDGNLFPAYRIGAELYHLLPHKFEVSAGARFLSFPGEDVVLYTGYLGKYFKSQWVSLRPFVQKIENDWQVTGILMVRQYFNHADDHITLILSQGSTPLTQVGLEEIGRLGSSRVGLETQFRAGKNFLLTGLLSYEYEEYTFNSHRNRYTFGLSVQHKF